MRTVVSMKHDSVRAERSDAGHGVEACKPLVFRLRYATLDTKGALHQATEIFHDA